MRWAAVVMLSGLLMMGAGADELRAATFDIDVTPPIGAPLAYDITEAHWDLGLRAKGIVLLGAEEPIVLCAIDWIGIANDSYDAFREALAEAAGTSPDRVAVHALHQHDAPACDMSAEALLAEYGIEQERYNREFSLETLERLREAVADSLENTEPVTHVGTAEAEVYEVASNRRILGEDGTVRAMRFTACRDPELRAEPEGLIDPMLALVSLWNEDEPIAALSYYATHPQSYYRTGVPNPDFPGVARFMRQLAVPQALHIHFTGAGGDIGAGKYNDGSPENRLILAERLADGMKRAWEKTERTAITPEDVEWRVAPAALPLGDHMVAEEFEATLESGDSENATRAARGLAWVRRVEAGHNVDITSLVLGPAQLLHLPAESLVAYQLAAKEMQPDRLIAVAAYGEYGPGYIGTVEAYEQGGYETSERASRVSPAVEEVLMGAIEAVMLP